ncbi:GTPase [Bosea sp. Tri-44]|uniref:CobW family GTP-binding protein n=1 Tax=Bosea sp. Tri-44 TaxID=1972137 RepID=UPI00100E9685|nr:GTP-binding protein [Bosea sp. Tri-44]RXT57444.1 GTPase [Bosea sp. Tri-44]
MATPILLIGGYLGAGKTTLINRLLQEAHGKRIAAIVNDFGAIDIDAALLESSSEGLVSLKNGCICCSLQGDLLRTLASVVKRDPAPDAIVIETSGISDPAEIIRSLLDPVIFKAAALETVLTLVDGLRVSEDAELWDDPLWLSQVRSADVLLVTKADLAGSQAAEQLVSQLERRFFPKPVFALQDELPMELMFGHGPGDQRALAPLRPTSPATFETVSWTAPRPLSLAKFQTALNLMSQKLLRAKGVVRFAEQQSQPLLFQLVGSRATLIPSPIPLGDGLAAAIVLIGRKEVADLGDITALLNEAVLP